MKYVCPICGYVYDEEKEGVAFADLPESWTCPLCGAEKSAFVPQEDEPATSATPAVKAAAAASPAPTASSAPTGATGVDGTTGAIGAAHPDIDDDMRQLSAGELSALCSNLARGCEKQYKDEEAALFRQIADAFATHAQPVEDASIEKLAALIQADLDEGHPAVKSAAVQASDRGTQRICVWGQKVTSILSTLMKRWQKEGTAFVENTQVWVCTVCGFVFVGDEPPALCPVCKVPAWKFEKIEGRRSA